MAELIKCFKVADFLAKEEKLMDLMYDCWRKGYKHAKILELAQEICSDIDSQGVKVRFRVMLDRNLGVHPHVTSKDDSQGDAYTYVDQSTMGLC
ncbi:hypothetical protein VPH70E341A_0150 [Vibrio phage 70E34-1a]